MFALAVAILAFVFGSRISDRQTATNRAHAQARELLDIRGRLRQGYIMFWENRFDGGAGVDAKVGAALTNGVVRINEMVNAVRDDPAQQRYAQKVQQDLAALIPVVRADYSGFAVGSATDRRIVDSSRKVINQLDVDVETWAVAAARRSEDIEADLRRFTRRFLIVIAGLVGALGLVGTLMWMLLERNRGRILRVLEYEHASRGAVLASVSDGLAVVGSDGRVVEANRRMLEILGQPTFREDMPLTYLDDPDVGPDFVGEHDLTITRPDGSTIPVIFSSAPLTELDGVARVHTLKDMTQRKRAEHSLQRMAAEQGALGHVATAVAAEPDPERIFELVAREVAELLGVSGAMVSRFDRDADRTVTVGTWSRDPQILRLPERIPLDAPSVIRSVLRNGIPARHADPSGATDDVFVANGALGSVSAPIRVESSIWGALTAAASDADLLPAGSELRLARFAELVGIAVANADARAQLALRATTDPLTGVLNHRTFHERLEREYLQATDEGSDLALIMVDLDHFKDVNDAFGHQTGDHVLRTFARFLESRARFGDIVARVGGEEFALLLPGADLRTAARVAERLVRAYTDVVNDDGVGRQTVSAGVSDLSLARGPDELKRLADAALYEAKSTGRNRAVVAAADSVRRFADDERADRLTRSRTVTALQALARAVDAKDPGTARHSERVALGAAAIAGSLGWSAGRTDELHEAALLHDVGKIGIPDELLLKPSTLTPQERERLRVHAILGAEIVGDVLSDEQAAWVRANHERWDGGGYPDGLAGEEIPLGAQVLAVADAWDAMTNQQTYRDRLSVDGALHQLRVESGRAFAPRVVSAVEGLIRDGVAPFGSPSPG